MEEEDRFATKTVKHVPLRGPINPVATPIYATSTFILDSAAHGATLASLEDPGDLSPWLYSRWGNPTTDVAARSINRLENAYGTHVTSTGMSAIATALFTELKTGDHIVGPEAVYGGTHEIFDGVLPDYGIEVTLVDATRIDQIESAIKDNTKVIYTETPANPTMSVTDLRSVAELAKSRGITTMVDSTFASPYNQRPIELGIDVVLHSATKYLGGHSDIVAGSISTGSKEFYKRSFQTLKLFGGTLDPFQAFLLARGIKTLDVRMERHNKNALAVAQLLENHPKIDKVYYPGLESHPQHELARNQMSGFGGMMAVEVKGGIGAGKTVIENLNTITLAVSLGGVETLIEHAASMTHTMVSREDRLKAGITDGMLRLSVGIEHVTDLIKDFEKALRLV